MSNHYELSQQQWERIRDVLSGKPGDPGRTAADNRAFVDAVLWVLGSRARWRDLPSQYGRHKSVHKRYRRWASNGVWRRMLAALGPEDPLQSLAFDRGHQMLAVKAEASGAAQSLES